MGFQISFLSIGPGIWDLISLVSTDDAWSRSSFFGRGDDLSFLPIISLASEEHYSFPLLRLVRASFWVLHFLVAGSDSQDRDYILSSLLVILSWEIAWPYEENFARQLPSFLSPGHMKRTLPGSYQRLDLFIKVLRVLCPNVTAAFRRSFYDMSALPVSWLSLGSAQIAISWSIILWH